MRFSTTLRPALDIGRAVGFTTRKLPTSVSLQMVQLQYRPLANQDEIRVIQLLTERDHSRYATGPVHCRIEHVPLNNSFLTAEGRGPAKGFDGTWPSPVVKDIEAQPQRRDGADSNVFWKRSLTECICGGTRSSLRPGPPSSNCHTEFEPKTNDDNDIQRESPELPWRYKWGDFVALSYVWGDPSVKCEILLITTQSS